MAKRRSATRSEARKLAEQRQAATLHRVQRLIDMATDVFEVDGRADSIDQRESDALDRAWQKYEKDRESIARRFDDERGALQQEKDRAIAAMLELEGVTLKEVADAAAVSVADVKRVRDARPQSAELELEPSEPAADQSSEPATDGAGYPSAAVTTGSCS